MAGEFQQTVDRINAKMQIVLERFTIVNRQRHEAEQRIGDLEEQVRLLTARNQRLQQEVEFLRIATTIAPDRKDVERTRALLSGLVREIDKCIGDLSE